jgi:hypothetical protein
LGSSWNLNRRVVGRLKKKKEEDMEEEENEKNKN